MTNLDQENFIEVAKCAGSYGVRGDVRVFPIGTGEALLAAHCWIFKARTGVTQELHPTSVKAHGEGLLVHFKEIVSKEEADTLKGVILISRDQFPETQDGEFWAVDLIGFDVVNRQGEKLGNLERFENNGAHEILVVESVERTHRIPLVKAYVEKIDSPTKTIHVDWESDWG